MLRVSMQLLIRFCCSFTAFAVFTPQLLAAEAPPLKPGLWQIRSGHTTNGRPLPMGAGPSSATTADSRVCMTSESMQRGQFQGQAEASNCQTSYSLQTASHWKWHTVCSMPRGNGSVSADGDATFISPESYWMTLISSMQLMGHTTLTTSRMTAKWLAADCGKLQPQAKRANAAGSGVPRK